MPFVWSIGTIIGPGKSLSLPLPDLLLRCIVDTVLSCILISAIGGLLARPSEGYPSLFPSEGLFGRFPYLLPNLVCSVLLLLSIIGGWLFLQETHPEMQYANDSFHLFFEHTSAEQPLLATSGATANAGVDLRAESYGTFNQISIHEDENWAVLPDGTSPMWKKSQKPNAFTWRVTMLVIALAIFTYHSMTYDHLLPIFLQDENTRSPDHHSLLDIPGGVGLSTQTVGMIMSTDGIIALIIQSLIFPALASWLGVWRLFVIVTILHPIAYFMVPFVALLPQNLVFIGIYACLIVRNILSIIDYPVLLILIKQASPSDSVLGKINGLAASAGAASRTIAPPIAGFLYSTGAEVGCTALAWWGSSFVALLGAAQLWFIQRKRNSSVVVASAVPCHYGPVSEQVPSNIVHIIVTDFDADADAARDDVRVASVSE